MSFDDLRNEFEEAPTILTSEQSNEFFDKLFLCECDNKRRYEFADFLLEIIVRLSDCYQGLNKRRSKVAFEWVKKNWGGDEAYTDLLTVILLNLDTPGIRLFIQEKVNAETSANIKKILTDGLIELQAMSYSS